MIGEGFRPQAESMSGAEADEPLQTRTERHERVRKMLKLTFQLEEGRVPNRKQRSASLKKRET